MNNIIKHIQFPSEELMSNRDGFGEAMVELGRKNSNIYLLTADLTESTRANWFKEQFPDRFVQVGVAEQNLVTIASGMAAVGKIPFVTSYAAFSPGRNWEQIRTTICYNNQPVKIIGSHAGLSVGPDGATHQALEDIALMRVVPNMTVIVPSDYLEARKAVLASVAHPGPVYIRLSRDKTPIITTHESPFEIGLAEVLREGSDITIIATGPQVYDALLASENLAFNEISAEVINVHTIKPLDENTILTSVMKTGGVVTVEDHQIAGGLGSVISELVSERKPVFVKRVGVVNRFGQSGNPQELYQEYGINEGTIVQGVKEVLAKTNK